MLILKFDLDHKKTLHRKKNVIFFFVKLLKKNKPLLKYNNNVFCLFPVIQKIKYYKITKFVRDKNYQWNYLHWNNSFRLSYTQDFQKLYYKYYSKEHVFNN